MSDSECRNGLHLTARQALNELTDKLNVRVTEIVNEDQVCSVQGDKALVLVAYVGVCALGHTTCGVCDLGDDVRGEAGVPRDDVFSYFAP